MDLMDFIENNWFQITLIATIVVFVYKTTRKIDDYTNNTNNRFDDLKNNIDELRRNTNSQIEDITNSLKETEGKRVNGQERTRLIMEGIEATLISLKNDGHNGPVTKSLHDINEYKMKKASE